MLQEKKKALENLNDEHEKEMYEIKRSIASQGATFDQYGNISNYNQLLDKMTKYADSLGSEAGKNAYEAVKSLKEEMDAYTRLCNDELPNVTKELEEMTKQINDLATSTLEETRNQLADAIRKTREQEKEEQLKVLDDRIAELRKEIANLEDEDNDKQKKLAKLKAELAKWQEDDSTSAKKKA